MMNHDYQDLVRIFSECFEAEYNTVLVAGADEPEYLPADAEHPRHRIIFAHGFFRSALHEVAHWCVAGPQRRLLADFGYWYAPDGRSAEQQQAFEQVEVKPQAYEWLFCQAAGHKFRVSLDNLNGEPTDSSLFKQRVLEQTLHFLNAGLPERPARFVQALLAFYRPGARLHAADFSLEQL
ncbi:diaminobutyrate-2-oxoglutarate aminotransferase [Pseudomonas sp. WN033]|nr:diaminobutyrate-2-oxoglutarate aminotransferase [Pseudomonas sp. WN033]